ncbi:MAG: helix-turn-helix domain-containing protein [Coriobacteriales bacterium]|jgi:HTH-type transcriptional regulator/antitoxin HipB|nr:helix-turn-helix domain-containing protein [Coriobacteriales bacterium]
MNVEIAERLAKRRREAGYSQEVLAEKLGVTRQAVSKWERSESSPDTDNLIALARLYKVSLDELLNIDPSLEDDMAFETADRAQEYATDYEPTGQQTYSGQAVGFDDPSGFEINDDENYVHINWRDGVHVKDKKTGEEVHVGWHGIDIKDNNSKHNWADDLEYWLEEDSSKFDDKGYGVFINGRRLRRRQHGIWYKFPFPLIAVLAYLLLGFFGPALLMPVGAISPWGYGLFVIAAIPLYYMVVEAIVCRRPLRFLQGLYPLACVVFFLWMWIMLGVPHPTWIVFLTIPIIEWFFEVVIRQRRKAKAVTVTDVSTPIDTSGLTDGSD